MLCPICGYALDPFDVACPRCSRGGGGQQRANNSARHRTPGALLALGILGALCLLVLGIVLAGKSFASYREDKARMRESREELGWQENQDRAGQFTPKPRARR